MVSFSGGGLKFWLEAYSTSTQTNVSFTPKVLDANVSAVIKPKGTGALLASIPDGTAVGGNARGAYAVDLQMIRSAATQVASANYTTILGGRNNTNNSSDSVLVAGKGNTIYNHRFNGTSVLVGGENNSIGTGSLTPDGYNFLGGGLSNILAPLSYSILVGGYANSVGGEACSMVGGQSNTLGGNTAYCLIGGGYNNTITASVANQSSTVIVGGYQNNNTQQYGFIGGGQTNSVTSNQWSSIVGGLSNSITNSYAFIGGGQSNTASGQWSTVAGGKQNGATNSYATVVGGLNNSVVGQFGFVGGGSGNYAAFTCDTIGGGESNVLGGQNNSNHRFIGGGVRNTINAEQTVGTTICGGIGNTIYFGSAGAIICGGGYAAYPGGNFLSGSNSALVGGQGNRIGNGYGNYTTYAFIGGGGGNVIDTNANSSVISGGDTNIVRANVVGATITGGIRGAASLYGQQVHASGQFSAQGDAQAHELVWRNAITGTTTTELFLDGTAVRAVLPATNTVWKGIINVAAVCTNAGGGTTVVGDVAAIDYTVTVKRIAGNTVLVAAAANITGLDSDASMATSAFVIAADNVNEALTISYTPPATADATTVIRVVATFRGLQIQY